jgi:secreted trypsin-like serine protease
MALKTMKPSLAALCLSLSLVGCGADSIESERYSRYRTEIINGTKADHSQFPSIVVLKTISSGEEYCSGTLIKPDLVMTAAHCLDDFHQFADPLSVVYGSSDLADNDGLEIQVAAWDRHAQYNPYLDPWNDIALILLENDIPDAVNAPILAPEQYETFLMPGTIVTIAGYGQNSDLGYGELFYGEVPVIVRDEFQIQVGENNPAAPNACYGDSGGPIYVMDGEVMYVTGVASHLPFGAQQCGESAIYTLPGSYVPWIEETYLKLQEEAQNSSTAASSSSANSSSSSSSGSGGSGGEEGEEYPAPEPEKYLVPSGGCGSCTIGSTNTIDPFWMVGLLYLARRRKK